MGRSRRRARSAAASAPASAPRAAAPSPRPPVAGADLRRTLAAYLGGALVLAVLVLLGTVVLGGTLGPWIVLAVAAAGGYGLHRWASARLAGAPLGDEDRTLQTMAGGLLVLVLAFAAVAAAILTVVG
jgi:hypothetical protein